MKHQAVQTHGGIEVKLHAFSTPATDRVSCNRRCALRKWVPGTHRTAGWVGPTAGLAVVKNKQLSCYCHESKPDFFQYIQQMHTVIHDL